jgi:hypothetical protein
MIRRVVLPQSTIDINRGRSIQLWIDRHFLQRRASHAFGRATCGAPEHILKSTWPIPDHLGCRRSDGIWRHSPARIARSIQDTSTQQLLLVNVVRQRGRLLTVTWLLLSVTQVSLILMNPWLDAMLDATNQ